MLVCRWGGVLAGGGGVGGGGRKGGGGGGRSRGRVFLGSATSVQLLLLSCARFNELLRVSVQSMTKLGLAQLHQGRKTYRVRKQNGQWHTSQSVGVGGLCSWTPPTWFFGPAWTILYSLMVRSLTPLPSCAPFSNPQEAKPTSLEHIESFLL